MQRPLDIGWLRIFEAVGRLGSLTRAANELGLSQPAVTYQIKRVEDQLGVSLLHRSQGGSRLTDAGEVLFEAVKSSVESIDKAVRDTRRSSQDHAVRIFTDFGFAAFWLMPRVTDFRRLHPEAEVHIIASQGLDDELGRETDAAMLFGSAEDFPDTAQLLIPERVVPVCTPGFLERFGPFDDPAQFARAPLLHLEVTGKSRWLTWESWLADHGIDRKPAQGDLGLNTYGFVIQAALAEQGVALGWRGLIEHHIEQGSLVTVGTEVSRPDRGYWVVPSRSVSDTTITLLDWLTNET
ncbi:LysR family transcriptional regulator [Thalassospira tepidiphila]|jgi:putative choline sulfate-utilization transcription factor|uniref:choline sulfate utilization transcriptional regulator n=1 Tax=Thalassospira tepidiphila TaxID=393657 RepID=UPI001BD00DBE|nr:LysR substrate-binding domain-containing protein [Thalassospira tepidiphila]MBS8273501.1 LysR family transcriptional regulator [Thalassospira tepidiphila]